MNPQGEKEILLENLFGVHPIPDPCFRRLEKEDLEKPKTKDLKNEDPRKRRPPWFLRSAHFQSAVLARSGYL